MRAERSSAWTLSAVCAGLIAYASLHPFLGWSLPLAGWAGMLRLPWPHYVSGFDVLVNVLGYLPLGAFLTTARLRTGAAPGRALLTAVLAAALLSESMEALQQLLPGRVPSALDWVANVAGALAGALLVLGLQALGALARWATVRDRHILPGSGFSLALLWLWPVGLLYPPPLPFALGQVADRLEALATLLLPGGPPAAELQAASALGPSATLLASALALLTPCALAATVTRPGGFRAALLLGALLLGVAVTTLSTALNFGPGHAGSWWTPALTPALGFVLLMLGPIALLPARSVAAMALPLAGAALVLANLAPADPYHLASLAGWEQGRFIRFHGVSQWVGWAWPYAACAALAWRLLRSPQADPRPDRFRRPS